MRKVVIPCALLAALPITAAHAYIGPGAGAGTIAIVLGILSSIFLAFVGILWYPIKRLFKRRKGAAKVTGQSGGGASVAAASPTPPRLPAAGTPDRS